METKKHFEAPPGWGSRHTLAILGCWAFAMSYSMRFNISIAIVSMVNTTDAHHVPQSDDINGTVDKPVVVDACPHLLPHVDYHENGSIVESHEVKSDGHGEFNWDAKDQGQILASFFYGYVLTQLPGGVLADRYGGKWPLGLGLGLAGVATLLTPGAARTSKFVLMMVRSLAGIGEGFAFPAMHGLLAAWAPPDEKSKLASIVYAGAQFGTAFTMVVSGYLISGNVMGGWPSVFYVIGALTMAWFVLWCIFVYNRPSEHPRINPDEFDYLQKSIGESFSKVKMDIPWKEIFTSAPFWAIMVGHIGHAWGLYTLLHKLPAYLKSVLHFDMKANGWLSALPYVLMWLSSIGLTQIADYLISKNLITTVVVRKGCQAIAHIGSAILLIAAAFSGCDRTAAVTLLTLSVVINGAIYGGYVVNHVDIARNYASVLSGITHTVANFTGFSVPYVASLILGDQPTLTDWQYVFFIAAAVYVIDVIFYCIFASATEQSWNRGHVSYPMRRKSVMYLEESVRDAVVPLKSK